MRNWVVSALRLKFATAPSYETADEIREFLAGNGASSLVFASDTDTRLITAYRINQVSTAVILDAAGTEVFRAVEPGAA